MKITELNEMELMVTNGGATTAGVGYAFDRGACKLGW